VAVFLTELGPLWYGYPARKITPENLHDKLIRRK